MDIKNADNAWKNKKVTVLGFGRSGASTARFLQKHGASVLVSDSAASPDATFQDEVKELERAGVRFEFGNHSGSALEFSDLIVASPGISVQNEMIKKAIDLSKEVICDIELAYRSTTIPMIGVTGTNGKSTTTALISHILSNAGKGAPACGNFGVPILSQLGTRSQLSHNSPSSQSHIPSHDQPHDPLNNSQHDYLVVEVSSFQLEYCKYFAPHVAVWLNFTPDHLEWHGSLEHYKQAKLKIFANQTSKDYAVLNIDDPVVAQVMDQATTNTSLKASRFPFSVAKNLSHEPCSAFLQNNELSYCFNGQTHTLCAPEQLQIKGMHNVENALAAVAATATCGLTVQQITRGLASFKPLEHRLEFAGTINEIAFYNDSKATNVSSTLKALGSFPDEKIVLIAGGRDKGTELTEFVEAVKQSVSAVILLGEAGNRFENALKSGGFTNIYRVGNLEEAVDLGRKLNKGPVVLSPACASYDMFKNYEERGRVFKDLVRRRT